MLVRRIREGDRSAFEELVERYLRRALAVAWEFTETREDAEDLVQETFVRMIDALPRFDVGRPFAPWFFTILRNLGRNAARRRAGVRFEPLPDQVGVEGPLSRIERRLDLEAVLERLPELMTELSPMQESCFRLCDLEGFEPVEVSAMLGVAPATVRVHLHRARTALREGLAGPDEEGRAS